MSCVRRLLTVAQDVSATLGVTRTMKSTILGEERKVFVHLPASYDTSGDAYPVLYLLDGTTAFLLEIVSRVGAVVGWHHATDDSAGWRSLCRRPHRGGCPVGLSGLCSGVRSFCF